jgi:predicted nucleotidyltransferase
MAKTPSKFPFHPERLYSGNDVPMRVIRRYARAIADEFRPDKIILFGSHAYGTPHADSDVDILVVMPTRNEIDQRVKIRWQIPAPFPVHVLVRKPKNLKWRLEEGESFHTEILSKGKILYEKSDSRMGSQGRRRPQSRRKTGLRNRVVS